MEWAQAKQNDEGLIDVPSSWIYITHYEALNILFRIENALRVFVYCILKENYGAQWTGLQISTAETDSIAISRLTSRRISQQQDFAYLGNRIASPMMYLNSGELIYLIFADNYWPKFAPYLEGKKEILRNKLEEISTIRNSLAHFRPITQDDVDVVKQNCKHAFGGIDACLRELTSCHKIVATNTLDDWYKGLSNIGNEICTITLHESPNKKWIRLQLDYSCALLETSADYDTSIYFLVGNLISPSILDQFEKLAERVLFVNEWMPGLSMPDDKRPEFRKQVSLTFSSATLKVHYKEIAGELKQVLSTLIEDRDLLASDRLARAKLLSADTVQSVYRKRDKGGYWYMNEDSLLSKPPQPSPPEFWGTLGRFGARFVDNAARYPWMPSAICEDFPF